MPDFYVEEMFIDPEEFVQACSKKELKELVDYLVEEGIVKRSTVASQPRGYDEQVFEEALLKLSGRWNMLSAVESEFISNIAKRLL
jgi:DNA-binding Lrp family transcriptional regulator